MNGIVRARRATATMLGTVRAGVATMAALLLLSLLPTALSHPTGFPSEDGVVLLHYATVEGGCDVTVEGWVAASEGTIEFWSTSSGPSPTVQIDGRGFAGEDAGDGSFVFAETFSFGNPDQPVWVDVLFEAGGEDHLITEDVNLAECRNFDVLYPITLAGDYVHRALAGCAFWVEGRYLHDQEGTLFLAPAFEEEASVPLADIEAVPQEDGPGFTFLLGPFDAPAEGQWTLAFVGADDRVTWSHHFEVVDCEPTCEGSLVAEALAEGRVGLSWGVSGDATGYEVQRRVAGEEAWTPLATVDDTSFVDEATEPGVTYQYRVLALGQVEVSCGEVEVTAVPFFGPPLLAALAGVGAIFAYAGFRRA